MPRRTQEERSNATRAALLDATVDLVVEQGYAQTTTHKIADRAGVSRGALLHHYPSKAALVTDAVRHLAHRRIIAMHEEIVDSLPAGPERIPLALDALWESCQSPLFGATIDLWAAARIEPELANALRDAERGLEQGYVDLAAALLGEETAVRPGFRVAVQIALAQMRGLAVLSPLQRTGRGQAAAWRASREALTVLFDTTLLVQERQAGAA